MPSCKFQFFVHGSSIEICVYVYIYIYILAGRNRKFNVTRERLDDEINKLNSEGFEVWRTS